MKGNKIHFQKKVKISRYLLTFMICTMLFCTNVLSSSAADLSMGSQTTEETTEEAIEETAEEITEEVTEETAEEIAEEATEETAEEITEEILKPSKRVSDPGAEITGFGISGETDEPEKLVITPDPNTAEVSVSNWGDFIKALQNSNVSVINVEANLKRAGSGNAHNPGTIKSSKTIYGNNHTVDFDSASIFWGNSHVILGNPESETATLNLIDVTLVKTEKPDMGIFYRDSIAASAKWNINMENVKTTDSRNVAGLMSMDNASVTVYGTDNELSLAGGGNHFYVKKFEMAKGSVLTTKSTGASNTAIHISSDGEINLREGSKLTIDNTGSSTGDSSANPDNSHGIYGSVKAMNMEKGSGLTIETSSVCYRTLVGGTFKMADGAVMTARSTHQSAVVFGDYGMSSTVSPISVDISGEGTQLNCWSSSANTSLGYGATIRMGTEGDSEFILRDGAEVNAHHTQNSCLQFTGEGNQIRVVSEAKLNATQNSSSNAKDATLRFLSSGSQSIEIDNAEANIRKLGGRAAAVRLFGGGNSIKVTNGGRFDIYNAGNGSPSDGASEAGSNGNQGIQYTDRMGDDSFHMDGYGSTIDIRADYGPAIYSTTSIAVTTEEGAVFIADGRTYSSDAATLQSAGKLLFTMNKPLYFDIKNRRPSGGNVVGSGNSGSRFVTTSSDLSVWGNGTNLNGNPTKSWSLFDFTLTGTYFETIDYTSDATNFNWITYGTSGTKQYSRISANNAPATIDELRVPTNADKYIFGHAYAPEGVEDVRDAWTGEVYVTLQVKNADETDAYTVQGTTVGTSNDGSSNGLKVYDDDPRAGIFKIAVPGGVFLEAGQTIEVISAYRSAAGYDTDRVHTSPPENLLAEPVTVRDVTPPEALTIGDLNLSTPEISVRTSVISGVSSEIGATVYLYKNDSLWKDGTGNPVTVTVGEDGKWSITLPETLQKDNKLAIALNDNQPNPADLVPSDMLKLTNEGIFTNNGNENPAKELNFHDATFKERLEIKVMQFGLCPFVLDVSTGSLTNSEGNILSAGIEVSGDIITVSSEFFADCEYEHIHELIVKGTAEDQTVCLTSSDASKAYNVYVEDVSVKRMEIGNGGTLTFQGETNSFKNTDASALVMGSVSKIAIESGSSVTAYANADQEPISLGSGKAKVLDLIMKSDESTVTLKIAGKDRVVPAGVARIAVMDELYGSWLSGNLKIEDKDSGKEYVRGTSAQVSSGQWDSDEDDNYSNQNHYGNTFKLDKENDTKGLYKAVRLPVPEEYLSVSVPVTVRFGMQLDGEPGNRGNTVLIKKEQSVTNNSFSCDDASLGKRFNLVTHKAEFYYTGLSVSDDEREKNGYTLQAYAVVKARADDTNVDKPMLALRGICEISKDSEKMAMELNEADPMETKILWFTMPAGSIKSAEVTVSTAKLYLDSPESEGAAADDYYQYPEDRTKNLIGTHHLNLLIKFIK